METQWFECLLFFLSSLTIVLLLELHRRQVAEGFEESALIEPIPPTPGWRTPPPARRDSWKRSSEFTCGPTTTMTKWCFGLKLSSRMGGPARVPVR